MPNAHFPVSVSPLYAVPAARRSGVNAASWIKTLLAATLLGCAGFMASARAATGELWETTSVMQSKAGTMDLGSHRDCHPVNWATNEKFKFETEGDCSSSNVKKIAGGYTWDIRCEDRHGRATLRRQGRDRVEIDMAMDTPDGHFVLHAKSRRVGACANPSEDD